MHVLYAGYRVHVLYGVSRMCLYVCIACTSLCAMAYPEYRIFEGGVQK